MDPNEFIKKLMEMGATVLPIGMPPPVPDGADAQPADIMNRLLWIADIDEYEKACRDAFRANCIARGVDDDDLAAHPTYRQDLEDFAREARRVYIHVRPTLLMTYSRADDLRVALDLSAANAFGSLDKAAEALGIHDWRNPSNFAVALLGLARIVSCMIAAPVHNMATVTEEELAIVGYFEALSLRVAADILAKQHQDNKELRARNLGLL